MREYNLTCHPELDSGAKYNVVVLGLAHNEFLSLDLDSLKSKNAIVFDVKGILKNADAKL